MTQTVNDADGIKELLPSREHVKPPPWGLPEELLKRRQRLYGSGVYPVASVAGRERQSGGVTVGRRSKSVRAREINQRRMLLKDPIIPKTHQKTTKVVRAGQALFGDLIERLVAMLSANPYQVQVSPLDEDQDSVAAATDKENFLHAFLLGKEGQRSILDRGATSVYRDWMDSLFSLGEGAFSLLCRRDRWSADSPGAPKRDDYLDDEDDVPERKRRSGDQKYLKARESFRKSVPPFVFENLHPLLVYIEQDDENVDDECIVVAERPYRVTLQSYGLRPSEGDYGVMTSGDGRRKYTAGPNGFGKAYPLGDWWGATGKEPDVVETCTYYCSPKRARFLGLVKDDADDDVGLWAHYVDGICVDYGPLWGPPDHPLPIFYTPGISTAIPDPNFTSLPGVMYLIELCDVIDQIITMDLNRAMWSSFPSVLEEDISAGGTGATGLPGDILENPESLQQPGQHATKEAKVIEPGQFYVVPPGKRWRFFVMPPEAASETEKLYARMRELFDLMGVPSVFRGQGSSGQPGYAIAQLMIAAQSVYQPILDNAQTTVAKACKYLLWQIWRRFPEGVPVYVGADGQKDGWITVKPADVAPDASGPGKGVPFLELTVTAKALLPTDEAGLEMRGANALAAGIVDMYRVREHYFGDTSPEETEAKVISDKVMNDELTLLLITMREQVRGRLIMPELAPMFLSAKTGVDVASAFQQLNYIGAFQNLDPAQVAMMQQTSMGGLPPGQAPVPGMPGPAQASLPPIAPTAPAPPPIQAMPGGTGQTPGATNQPSTVSRQAALVSQ